MTTPIYITGPDSDGLLWICANAGGLQGAVSVRADSIAGRAFAASRSSSGLRERGEDPAARTATPDPLPDAEECDFVDRLDAVCAAYLEHRSDDYATARSAVLAAFHTLRDEARLLTHKVITCGVAASHPDAGLSRRGAYAGKWDSPQAEEVRKLRDEVERLRSAARSPRTDVREALATLRSWTRLRSVKRGDTTYNGCEDCGAIYGEECSADCEVDAALRALASSSPSASHDGHPYGDGLFFPGCPGCDAEIEALSRAHRAAETSTEADDGTPY